jgi:threonyl-tRNA synthetase
MLPPDPMPTDSQEIPLLVLRRSAAEVLACTVLRVFPNTFLVAGDSNELGFTYDFVFEHSFSDIDLRLVEEQMRALIKEGIDIRSPEMMRENAANLFTHKGQEIQASIVMEVQENIVPVFQVGDFYDYCPLPHLSNTSEVAAFKLLKISEWDYLLTDQEEVLVTRITGTAFHDPMALKQHLKRLESAKKRDHQLLGAQMDLFGYCPESEDDWLWYPRGVILRELIQGIWKEEIKAQRIPCVATPQVVIAESSLIAPANRAVQHALLYQTKERSEVELPLRYAEWIQWFNNEEAEADDGLFQALTCSGDAESVFCKKEQLNEVLNSSLQFIQQIGRILGFEYHWYLTHYRREFQSYSDDEQNALKAMQQALEANGIAYSVDEQESQLCQIGAELRISDAVGRLWKGPSLAIDFETPKLLGLAYQGSQGRNEVPTMVVMTMIGSLERIIALLIEKDAGVFPLWLAPEQVRVVAIGHHSIAYAKEVYKQVELVGLRAGLDLFEEKLGAKIHRAEMEKIPYMLIVGDKEQSKNEVTVRVSGQDALSKMMPLQVFLEQRRGEGKRLES